MRPHKGIRSGRGAGPARDLGRRSDAAGWGLGNLQRSMPPGAAIKGGSTTLFLAGYTRDAANQLGSDTSSDLRLDSRYLYRFRASVRTATTKVGDWFVRNFNKIDLDHPEETAIGKPVFEVFPTNPC
jgi:hypothetical protein